MSKQSASRFGREAILEQFLCDGIDVMFGNPGTVEQGFLDTLDQFPDMKYILTLQESIAVLAGDGYARATKKPTLVQLHSSPGIGNAVGALYQAKRGHAPLVVIGGDAGTQYLNMDAQMAGDLVAMMEPVTKYATTVYDSRSLLRTLRRAIRIAATPPMGPVYICLPMNILDELNQEPVFPSGIPSTRTIPETEVLQETVDAVLNCTTPMVYVGDGISYSGAEKELEEFAELIGAEVWGADTGDLEMDSLHPCWMGNTGHMFGQASLPILQKGDMNLIFGTYIVPEVFPILEDVYKEGAKVIHFDLNAYEIGKNHRVDLGAVCDPRETLRELILMLQEQASPEFLDKAKERVAIFEDQKNHALRKQKEADAAAPKADGFVSMADFAKVLSEKVPEDTIIWDEALTNSPALTRYLPPREGGNYFMTRGGSLGVGIPGGIGAQLAHKDKLVVAFTGDGGSMYTIQALWSAARHKLPVKSIICNNHSYKLLELNIQQYWGTQSIDTHDFPMCFDLSRPEIDFAAMAQSMGVESMRVSKPEEIPIAIEKMLSTEGPFLIDLVVSEATEENAIAMKCGQ